MKRVLLKLALVALTLGVVSAAQAQILGLKARVGYYFGSSFDLRDGGSGSLQGLDLGMDLPSTNLFGFQFSISPSIMLGGRLGGGGDVDGNIYRFMGSVRKDLTLDGVYGQFSLGFAHTEPRGGEEFRSRSGWLTGVTVGFPIRGLGFLGSLSNPSVEGTYYFSSEEQFRGFLVGLAVRF